MSENQATPRAYETPKLRTLGSFSEITLANGAMNATDRNFPANTPFNQLTFS